MAQLPNATTSRLFSTSGTNYEAEIVSSSRGVLLDLRSKTYDTTGRPHVGNALAHLSVADAQRLSRLLNEAVAAAETADPRAPGLWSDTTVSDVARRVRT